MRRLVLRRALSYCCALLAAIALLMIAGLIAEGALNQMEAFDATTFTLVVIILLYFVLVAKLNVNSKQELLAYAKEAAPLE